ncbi:MAG TPA: 4-carboxy-4-hydroxy-2-oxoadipate aldolase/oxaloacetate decarboxylase [Ktedonobacteraceae bacterium]|jgi:4-hydroxy-4-methyl-2-oxoglutarate aldolase|nr:4-carboxy-4-hydroxy-2-oxoadipate aldolase/oxaloacetate decarboxylase [Ktedonobacteraceae bacterium]
MNDLDITRFAHYGVATVYEAAGRSGLIDVDLIQIVPGSRAAGPARTVRCGQADNLMVHAVLDQVQPGEVLVLTMPQPEPVALVGELLATQARVRQVAGLLIDASARDTEELRELGLPIWTRWVRVRGATKTEVGAINEPVVMGGATIAPGDIVVLDADGAVVVPRQRAEQVLAAAQARQEREADLRKKLEAGALSYDLHGLRGLVEG